MSELENTQLVKQAYESFKTGDIASLLNTLEEGVTWQLPDIVAVTFSGRREGRERVGQFFADLNEYCEVLSFEPRDFVAQGDKVVSLGHYSFRVRATGKAYESDFAHVFTIAGGRVSKFQEFTDTAAVEKAFQG